MTQQESAKIILGDVLFSKQENCKITVSNVEVKVNCVWFDIRNNPHEKILPITDLSFIQKKKQLVAEE